MTDTTISAPAFAASQQLAASQGKIGFGKIASAGVAGLIATYFMNYASLHGVDFSVSDIVPGVKMSSEFVKSTLEGAIEAGVVALTPNHFVAAVIDVIRWGKNAMKQIKDAYNQP